MTDSLTQTDFIIFLMLVMHWADNKTQTTDTGRTRYRMDQVCNKHKAMKSVTFGLVTGFTVHVYRLNETDFNKIMNITVSVFTARPHCLQC